VQKSAVDYSMLVKDEKFVILSKDKKFMALSKNIGKEYEQGFSQLIKSAQKSNQ